MSLVALIMTPEDVSAMVPMACQLAASADVKHATIAVFAAADDKKQQQDNGKSMDTVDADAASTDDISTRAVFDALPEEAHLIAAEHFAAEPEADSEQAKAPFTVSVRLIRSKLQANAVLQEVSRVSANLLLLPKREKIPQHEVASSPLMQLFQTAPCNTLLVRPGEQMPQFKRILVPASGGPHANVALRLAVQLAEMNDGQVDALYVEPPIGDDAPMVGRQILGRIIRRAVEDSPRVRPKVLVNSDFREGIAKAVSTGEYDLLLVGNSDQWFSRKVLFSAIPQDLLSGERAMAVAVMRRSLKFPARLRNVVRQTLERMVPQLEREDRITLAERIQMASRWNVDFIMLIALSTLIATLGLVRDSAAVVIGAMLVAPLMTPLVGAGLALVQGNLLLVRQAAKSVLFGFLLALVIGFLVGMFGPGVDLTDEILSRGSPNLLDLGIAFVSGIAGAYATARPNLSSALPGVAIAAALVPPIASVGLCLALGQPWVAAGATLLFLTNIVAIVLGAALTLYAVGVVGQHSHGRSKPWVGRLTMMLILLTVVVSVPLGYLLYDAMPRDEIRDEVKDELRFFVAESSDSRVEQLRVIPASTKGKPLTIHLTLVGSKPAEPTLAAALAAIVKRETGKPCAVAIHTKLTVESLVD